mmetsp:Transcript_41216/g.74517  ORF Transcript_41216/g.74517 Transcript_41216/m.74517 type:complete len:556 (-) Transcript_41216:200-1867(-)
MAIKAGHVDLIWSDLKQRCFAGEILDEVFEGRIRGFCAFDVTMQAMKQRVNAFMTGMDHFAKAMRTHSEGVCTGMAYTDDIFLASEGCKLKQAMNQISHVDAPHSHISKIQRDMDFNVVLPIQKHIVNNQAIRGMLDQRRQKLVEMGMAKQLRHTPEGQKQFETAVVDFHKLHAYIFEWFYVFEQHRGDILDSILQTLKHLQYQFFATSAHAIGSVLPARLEFRPMVEMTPEMLHGEVMLLLQAPVDGLSLTALKSQGFEDGPARRALRLHQNDTQAALDWLLEMAGGAEKAKVEDGVRAPVSIKLIKKLLALKRKSKNPTEAPEEAVAQEESKTSQGTQEVPESQATTELAPSETPDNGGPKTEDVPAEPTPEAPEEPQEASQDQPDGPETASAPATSSTSAPPKVNNGLGVMPPSLHGPQFATPPQARAEAPQGPSDVSQKCREHIHVQSIQQGTIANANRERDKCLKALADAKAESARLTSEVQSLQSKLHSVEKEMASLRVQLVNTEGDCVQARAERDRAKAAAEESECLAAEVARLQALQALRPPEAAPQ